MNWTIRTTITATMVLVMCASSTSYAKPCKKQSVVDLVKAVAEAFVEKKMGRLDANRPYVGTVRIVIEHSLADDDDPQRFEIRKFSSMARAERWLKSREIEEWPGRYSRPPEKCERGVCTYNLDGGINHKSLYLQKITYGIRGGCPYVKTIYLLDGD